MKDNSKYNNDYSEESLFNKIKSFFSKAGVSVVYGALLLFYALKDPNVPIKAKATIISALGYFISPIDLIADPIPVVGYGDDFTAIITALGVISVFITPEIKRKAKEKTKEWFSNVGEEDFREIDKNL
ncbi:YkvA family protein [uncultured Clostridium sp.]|uniref:YkvA family protein n=1 Tax=uncultured Clostridium sp. TaxID=59620 RepID=UPI0025D98D5A|nr:YkvA family protein [uncultured Clostridium sp.]